MTLEDKIYAAPVVPDLYRLAVAARQNDWLHMEFGVATGTSLQKIRNLLPPDIILFGFDSFRGLPEPWTVFPKGTFATSIRPQLPNTQLIEGWFDQTVPLFAERNPWPVSFIHIDCDLYSSTKIVLDSFRDQLVKGSVIVFDELFGYDGYEQYEFRALQELDKPFKVIGRWDAYRAAIQIM